MLILIISWKEFLNNQSAQEQLDKLTLSWQEEIEILYQEIDMLYKKYQADQILLTQEMKTKREVRLLTKKRC